MSSDLTDDEPVIVLRNAHSGAVILRWRPPRALWRDMEAFSMLSGLSIEQLMAVAIERFIRG